MHFDTRYKYYGTQLVEVIQANRPVFNDSPRKRNKPSCGSVDLLKLANELKGACGACGASEPVENAPCVDPERSALNKARAQQRAKKNVFDLAMCNPDLNLFVTLTLDGSQIDRYNYDAIIRKLNQWLDNRVRRNGLKYVLVAEYHKDKAIHFHALFNDVLEKVDSGHKTKSDGHLKTVYNLPCWTLGYTTAIYTTGERAKVCNYITKYITKSENKVGGRWYYSGGKLSRPDYSYSNTYLDELLIPEDIENPFDFQIENTQTVYRIHKM